MWKDFDWRACLYGQEKRRFTSARQALTVRMFTYVSTTCMGDVHMGREKMLDSSRSSICWEGRGRGNFFSSWILLPGFFFSFLLLIPGSFSVTALFVSGVFGMDRGRQAGKGGLARLGGCWLGMSSKRNRRRGHSLSRGVCLHSTFCVGVHPYYPLNRYPRLEMDFLPHIGHLNLM